MNGTLARVLGAYPLAFPAVFAGLAMLYPDTFSQDADTGVYVIRFTIEQLLGAAGGAYAIIGGVFAKWGKM